MAGIELIKAPGWDQYKWLRHGFSTRPGGSSTVYSGQSLNLGWTKEDDPARVTENRRIFVEAAGAPQESPMRLVTARQTHSKIVKAIGEEGLSGNLETPEGKAVIEADGLVTDIPGLLIAVGTADCVPVLLVDPVNRAVGAFHAGWRGTVARIVEHGIDLMRQEYGATPQSLVAAVGPSIGACCYAVGEEVRDQFACEFAYGRDLFTTRPSDSGAAPKLFVDLWEANRRQLLEAGIAAEQIAVIGECTACTRLASRQRKYFSHRAEHGVAGRMLNAIGIAD